MPVVADPVIGRVPTVIGQLLIKLQNGYGLCSSWIILFCDIKPVRTKEGKFYWKIPLGVDDATREK